MTFTQAGIDTPISHFSTLQVGDRSDAAAFEWSLPRRALKASEQVPPWTKKRSTSTILALQCPYK